MSIDQKSDFNFFQHNKIIHKSKSHLQVLKILTLLNFVSFTNFTFLKKTIKMIRYNVFILLLPFFCFSQTENEIFKIKTYENASDEVYAEILMTENYLKIENNQNWLRTEKIVCLSGITPKKVDHQYMGLSFKPTTEDLEKWKAWFRENKKNLKYVYNLKTENKIIVLIDIYGNIRRSDCNYNN